MKWKTSCKPEILLLRDILPRLLEDPKVFPQQMGYVISPTCSGSAPGSYPHIWTPKYFYFHLKQQLTSNPQGEIRNLFSGRVPWPQTWSCWFSSQLLHTCKPPLHIVHNMWRSQFDEANRTTSGHQTGSLLFSAAPRFCPWKSQTESDSSVGCNVHLYCFIILQLFGFIGPLIQQQNSPIYSHSYP